MFVVVPGVLGTLERTLNLFLGLYATNPVSALNGLTWLKVLVDLEEVLDLKTVEVRDIIDVLTPRGTLVSGWNTQNLVISAGLITHAEHAKRAATNEATREGWLLEQHESVERVAVFTEGSLNEAVVVRVAGCRKEHTVKTNATGLVVNLVLVSLTLRNLDSYVEFHFHPPLHHGLGGLRA